MSTENPTTDRYASFPEHDLFLLHTVLHTTNLYAVQKLVNDVKEQCKIDLSDEEAVAKLSEANYRALRQYERSNTDFLVASVINEYPESVKYLQSSLNGELIDPLGTFQKWFGAFIFFIGMAYLYLVTFCAIPEGNQRFADMITGVIVSQLFQIAFAYIFRHRQESPWEIAMRQGQQQQKKKKVS